MWPTFSLQRVFVLKVVEDTQFVYLQPLLRNPPSFVPIEGSVICDFILMINTNLAPTLHRFRDIAFDRSKIAIFGYPSCV